MSPHGPGPYRRPGNTNIKGTFDRIDKGLSGSVALGIINVFLFLFY